MHELHILGGGAAAGLVKRCSADFEQTHHARLHGTFGAVGAMKTRLLEGAPCDVLILTQALIESLVADGQALADSVTQFGAQPFCLLGSIVMLSVQISSDYSHAILCQCTRFVGADGCCISHSLT